MEIKIGQYNTLKVVKSLDFGVYLDGGELGEILMPAKWVPPGTQPGDDVEVFIYFDSEDRPIATTLKPKATVGSFAWLKVKAVDRIGAFLDWGLDKDLLVPFSEQNAKMEE
ncbi:MAG: S1-like domain-containing RNA-binding protein, partial [Bacteroidota bacterium]